MTEAIELAGEWRGRMLHELWSVTGLGDHIADLVVKRTGTCHVILDADANVGPLVAAYELLDDGGAPYAYYGAVFLSGVFRGVPVLFALKFTSDNHRDGFLSEREAAATPAAEAALADLQAAIAAAGLVA